MGTLGAAAPLVPLPRGLADLAGENGRGKQERKYLLFIWGSVQHRVVLCAVIYTGTSSKGFAAVVLVGLDRIWEWCKWLHG